MNLNKQFALAVNTVEAGSPTRQRGVNEISTKSRVNGDRKKTISTPFFLETMIGIALRVQKNVRGIG